MNQKLVTFSNSVVRVDAATIYECWKNGDIVDVRSDGQTYFVSADMLTDLASEGLIHQDGLCGKGWTGTQGFCKRLKKVQAWDKKRTEKFQALSTEEKTKRLGMAAVAGGLIGAASGVFMDPAQRRAMGRGMNNFARKAGESAGRAASKYKRRGSQVSRSIGALPPGIRTITETL